MKSLSSLILLVFLFGLAGCGDATPALFETCGDSAPCGGEIGCWLLTDNEGVCLPSGHADAITAACADGRGVYVWAGNEAACFPTCNTDADCASLSGFWKNCDFAEVVSAQSDFYSFGMAKVCAISELNVPRLGPGSFCTPDGICDAGLSCQGDAICLAAK